MHTIFKYNFSFKVGTTRAVTVLHVRITVTNAAIRPLQRTFVPHKGSAAINGRKNKDLAARSMIPYLLPSQEPVTAQTFVCGSVFELPIWARYISYQPFPFLR